MCAPEGNWVGGGVGVGVGNVGVFTATNDGVCVCIIVSVSLLKFVEACRLELNEANPCLMSV